MNETQYKLLFELFRKFKYEVVSDTLENPITPQFQKDYIMNLFDIIEKTIQEKRTTAETKRIENLTTN